MPLAFQQCIGAFGGRQMETNRRQGFSRTTPGGQVRCQNGRFLVEIDLDHFAWSQRGFQRFLHFASLHLILVLVEICEDCLALATDHDSSMQKAGRDRSVELELNLPALLSHKPRSESPTAQRLESFNPAIRVSSETIGKGSPCVDPDMPRAILSHG